MERTWNNNNNIYANNTIHSVDLIEVLTTHTL